MKKLVTVATLLTAGASQAAGFANNTHTARATGMTSAMTAHVHDASSVAFNPAGLAGLDTFELLVGGAAVVPVANLTAQGSTTAEATKFGVSPPPHLFVAYPFMKGFTAGVGVYSPYGAALEWPETFSGRFVATYSQMATFNINPTLAYAPTEWLRVGAGLDVLYGMLKIRQSIPLSAEAEAGATITGTDVALGFNAGVQADLVKDRLSAGLTYRSATTLGFKGDAEFTDVPEPLQAAFAKQGVTVSMPMPQSVGLGLSYTPTPRLLLAVDATWWNWSRLQKLDLDFENTAFSTSQPKNWHNRWQFSLGGEYAVTPALTVRAGAGYDPTPVPDETLTPELPDSNRIQGALGLTYGFGHLSLSGGYQLLLFTEKRSTAPSAPGTYTGSLHVLSFTLGYKV
ncbi:OmpP1/FadL family transporter [Corallococcus sp. CA053C]|uniref:OmpP1/FadL family transporter n=1 Tax=Corallococcus sp. CA053C TaxID=2316732 RepID=UPI0013151D90|nr:outer membrane protein transport protein [Corallococcus sp. CA053C]